MTPRERVRRALAHGLPDRIPLDLGATESSGLTGIAYHRLCRFLGRPGVPRIFDPYQQVTLIEKPLLEALQVDAVALHFEPRRWKASRLADGTPCEVPEGWAETFLPDGSREVRSAKGTLVARMPAAGFYYEPGPPPLADVSPQEITPDLSCIAGFDLPSFSNETWEERAARAKALQATGRAVVGNLCCHFLAAGQLLRGYETFLCDMLTAPKLAHALLEALCTVYLARAEQYVQWLGPYLDVILLNDDLGTQQGPMLSLDLYRKMIKPYQERLFGRLRSLFNGWLLFHSCGAIREFIPDLIDAGVQALNPIQISARGMDPESLKREFGKDLVFWGGGCDTQTILNRASPAAVQEHVQHNVRVLGRDGGFVFTQVHNIQPEVPPENIMAMLEALREV